MKKEDGKSSDGKIKTHLLADNITWRAYYVLNPSILSEGTTEEEAIINLKYGKWIKKPVMNALEKEFVPYQESLELKELGFDESCFTSFNNKDLVDWWEDPEPIRNSELVQGYITAPTFSQVFRWFREKYDLFGCIDLHVCSPCHWFIRIDKMDINDYLYHSEDENIQYNTHEEAQLACLRKLIEIVKNTTKP